MRVVMNGLAALKPKTGVGHYVARLHAALGDVTLYPGPLASAAIRRLGRHAGGAGGPPNRLLDLAAATAKHAAKVACGVHFARTARAIGYDLYHEPNFVPLPTDRPTVVTVHDLSVLLHPEWHPADRVKHHERHFAAAVRRAARVIVVSHQVRREMLAEFGVPEWKVVAVHNGVGREFRQQPPEVVAECRHRLGLPAAYFLCVGTVEPRKNVLAVLKAFAALPVRARERCPLVLAGPWGWKSEPERAFFEETAKPLGARHLGYVSAADLPAVYAGATALLYPSRYEGFGLPPAEMLACGGRVVASSEALAVREVAGPRAVYLPAADTDAWRDVMLRLANDPDTLPRSGPGFAGRYTWERCAAVTRAVYAAALGRTVGHVDPIRRAA